MNRKKTTTERFAFFVESIKKNIVTYLRETDKLARDLRKANGDADKQAILDKIKKARENAERYRLVLDDLTYAYVREYEHMGEKIVKHFKYKTVEGFLQDRFNPDIPNLHLMIETIANNGHNISTLYHFKYDEFGRRTVERDLPFDRCPSTITTFDGNDRRIIFNAVNSGSRHK